MGTTVKLGIGDIVTISDGNGHDGLHGRIVKIVTTTVETAKADMTGKDSETTQKVSVLTVPDMKIVTVDSAQITKN